MLTSVKDWLFKSDDRPESEINGDPKKGTMNGVSGVDYRKLIFCKMIWLDDGLAARGVTWQVMVMLVTLVFMTSFSFISIFLSSNAINRLDNVRAFLLESLTTAGFINEVICRKKLARLFNFFNRSMRYLRTSSPEELKILRGAHDSFKNTVALFFVIFVVNFFVIILSPPLFGYLQGNSWKKLPFPWELSPSYSDAMFWTLFTFQVFGIFISSCVGMITVGSTSITTQMTALFDILIVSIRNLDQRAEEQNSLVKGEYEMSYYKCFREDAVHYQQLLIELLSIRPHLRNYFFSLSSIISLVLACEAYPLIAGDFTTGDLLKAIIFLMIETIGPALICNTIEVMSLQNTEVSRALYMSSWYDRDVKFKKTFLNMFILGRDPIYIKSPLLSDVKASMATFYSFIVNSFTFLNMIRKLK